jgi:hypothetical protein
VAGDVEDWGLGEMAAVLDALGQEPSSGKDQDDKVVMRKTYLKREILEKRNPIGKIVKEKRKKYGREGRRRRWRWSKSLRRMQHPSGIRQQINGRKLMWGLRIKNKKEGFAVEKRWLSHKENNHGGPIKMVRNTSSHKVR